MGLSQCFQAARELYIPFHPLLDAPCQMQCIPVMHPGGCACGLPEPREVHEEAAGGQPSWGWAGPLFPALTTEPACSLQSWLLSGKGVGGRLATPSQDSVYCSVVSGLPACLGHTAVSTKTINKELRCGLSQHRHHFNQLSQKDVCKSRIL